MDFPVSKIYYTLINVLKVTENWEKKFSLAKLLKFTDNVVSLCITGVAKAVPGMHQICLRFTNPCVPLYCCIWNNHSSPGFNEVLFPHFSIHIWDTNWESSKIFCDKVGTRHKKTQCLLQTVCRLILTILLERCMVEQPYFRYERDLRPNFLQIVPSELKRHGEKVVIFTVIFWLLCLVVISHFQHLEILRLWQCLNEMLLLT